MASRSCEECAQWMYDDRTGAKLTDRRTGQPRPRPKGTKTPCWNCPKQSPAHASQYEFSNRNLLTLELYYQAQMGAHIPRDAVLDANLGIIHHVMTTHERAHRSTIEQLLQARAGA